jgi:hypothetical protein
MKPGLGWLPDRPDFRDFYVDTPEIQQLLEKTQVFSYSKNRGAKSELGSKNPGWPSIRIPHRIREIPGGQDLCLNQFPKAFDEVYHREKNKNQSISD